jgi:predicted ribosome quality control (RQC) complex YloA/Tae2 family protein
MKVTCYENIICKIGQNAKDNWNILSDIEDNFLFFHLSDFPSCYVIIEYDNDENPCYDLLKFGATICKSNTKYRNMKNIRVDWTRCNNIKKGRKLGEIYYKKLELVKNIII